MRLLLDTHVFLWWRGESDRIALATREAIATADVVMVSVVSAWEVAIKRGLGKIRLEESFEHGIVDSKFSKLGLSFAHAETVSTLEHHHADPFDRMLLAQARLEGLTIVTHDRTFDLYGQPVIRV